MAVIISACTTGKLHYTDTNGERKIACDVEFTGALSVDKFAVEYALSYCAKTLHAQGKTIDVAQRYLLDLPTDIPLPPCEKTWDHALAKAAFRQGQLSTKQYGYIVANIDLGLAKVNQCKE